MGAICFDTSIFVSYKPEKLPAELVMSAVVIQELTAGAVDGRETTAWRLMSAGYERAGRLLTPTGEEWWRAGKVLNSLLRGEKGKAGGRTPKLPAGEKQRIVRDALIAVSVGRAEALLVTENVRDFEMLRRYCAVRYVSGREYFGYGPGER